MQTDNNWSLASLSNLCTQIILVGHVEECESRKSRALLREEHDWQPPAEVVRDKNGRLNLETPNTVREVDISPRDTFYEPSSQVVVRDIRRLDRDIGSHKPYC